MICSNKKSDREAGIMENWNVGIMIKRTHIRTPEVPNFFHHSTNPLFHHSAPRS
jgi:hypothetical protein